MGSKAGQVQPRLFLRFFTSADSRVSSRPPARERECLGASRWPTLGEPVL
jgi:hypothetical protein